MRPDEWIVSEKKDYVWRQFMAASMGATPHLLWKSFVAKYDDEEWDSPTFWGVDCEGVIMEKPELATLFDPDLAKESYEERMKAYYDDESERKRLSREMRVVRYNHYMEELSKWASDCADAADAAMKEYESRFGDAHESNHVAANEAT